MKNSFCIRLLCLAFLFCFSGAVLAADDVGTDSGNDIETSEAPEASEAPAQSESPTVSSDYYIEVLTVLGNIQGYMIFFIVVLFLYFTYKFFRMFF